PALPVVGFIRDGSADANARFAAAFRKGLNETGYVTRCTTLTQFPVAFCGGRIENCAPVPGLTATTVPLKVWSGKLSTASAAFCPTRRYVISVSFGLASTQGVWSSITLRIGEPAATKRPTWILSTC